KSDWVMTKGSLGTWLMFRCEELRTTLVQSLELTETTILPSSLCNDSRSISIDDKHEKGPTSLTLIPGLSVIRSKRICPSHSPVKTKDTAPANMPICPSQVQETRKPLWSCSLASHSLRCVRNSAAGPYGKATSRSATLWALLFLRRSTLLEIAKQYISLS